MTNFKTVRITSHGGRKMNKIKILKDDEALTIEESTFLSHDGKSRSAYYLFIPKCDSPKGILQICHGMCEYVLRYEDFARAMCREGYIVCGNDHIGHGKTAPSDDLLGYTAKNEGAMIMVRDARLLSGIVRNRFPSLPLFLIGHSMGSFIARRYIELHGRELAGAIIVGTGGPESPTALGKALAKLIIKTKGEDHRSKLLDSIAFGSYNKKFKGEKDSASWLTRDKAIREKYVADKYCSFKFTARGFYDLFDLLGSVSSKEWANNLPKELPILIISGDADPVGNYGKGVSAVYDRMENAGMENVTLRLYHGARHELFNETSRDEIISHTLEWIESNLPITERI